MRERIANAATVAQHQRRKKAEQTKARMCARLMNGYWPFACPIGYRYEKAAGHGKTRIVRIRGLL